MVRTFRSTAAVLLSLASATMASAQVQPAAPSTTDRKEPQTLLERLKEPDQAGGLHFTEHFAVAFGGIKQGSGIALGPAVSHKFANGGFAQLKAVYSLKRFMVLQARYDTRRFSSNRGILISRLRWQVAPRVSLYRLGPDSPDARVEYGERKTEGSTALFWKLRPAVRVAGGIGIERYATSGGQIDLKEGDRALPAIPPVPGLGMHPWFAHTFGSLGFDTRTSTDYSRSGRFIEGSLHDYHDWHDGQDSFRRVEAVVQQLVPMYGERGVIDVSARTWVSLSSGERSVPFFLMPTLGGGEFLRAFNSYRFRDRDALLLRGEYRWAVHPLADVAGLYEAGTVASHVKGFTFDNLEHSIGFGIRVHSKTSSLFRADVAHGRDGFGFRVGFTTGGS
jgi:hypothetical protein